MRLNHPARAELCPLLGTTPRIGRPRRPAIMRSDGALVEGRMARLGSVPRLIWRQAVSRGLVTTLPGEPQAHRVGGLGRLR